MAFCVNSSCLTVPVLETFTLRGLCFGDATLPDRHCALHFATVQGTLQCRYWPSPGLHDRILRGMCSYTPVHIGDHLLALFQDFRTTNLRKHPSRRGT
ncbi:hypothetical protein ISCGN_002892 [Ixodes scapularis]